MKYGYTKAIYCRAIQNIVGDKYGKALWSKTNVELDDILALETAAHSADMDAALDELAELKASETDEQRDEHYKSYIDEIEAWLKEGK